MNVALVGYGRMGRAVEETCREKGHEVVLRLTSESNPGGEGLTADALADVDVAIDFSHPDAVVRTVSRVSDHGVDLVVGTTGWLERLDEVRREVEGGRIGLLYAPNFSLGVQLFFRLARAAGRLADGLEEYDVHVSETHHRHKVDHPSGTARHVAEILLEEIGRKGRWEERLPDDGPVDPAVLQVAAVRAGENPGTHAVALEGPEDRLELRHEARGRGGFARGAVAGAEWIRGRNGVFTIDDMLAERLERS